MEQPIIKYLTYLDLPVSKNYCKQLIISHPDYPSLLSAADMLSGLGLEHKIARTDEEHLHEISFPYMLLLGGQGGKLALIKSRDDLDDRKDEMEDWSGVLLKIEPGQTITDKQHNKQYNQEKRQHRFAAAAAATLGALLCVLLVPYATWLYGLLALTVAIGAMTGYLLLSRDLGITFKPVENFCNAGKRTSCDRILQGGGGQLLSFFSLSDATVSYFTFQLIIVGLFIPLFGSGAPFLVILFAASLLAVPLIVYSLYYQSAVAGAWCRLCLTVDVVLAAQVAILAAMMYGVNSYTWGSYQIPVIFTTGLVFFGLAPAIVLLKNRLEKANGTSRQATEANRVKQNPTVFTYLLTQSEKTDTAPFEQEMLVGNRQAPINVMMAINLQCGPCQKAWQAAEKLLEVYPNDISFTIRLTEGASGAIGELSASTYLIRYWKQHIYGKKEASKQTRQLLQSWYKEMNPEALATCYPANGELVMDNNDEEPPEVQHYHWMKRANITATPTLFVNGYNMPENYRLKDLKMMIPGLTAQVQGDFLKKIKKKLSEKTIGFAKLVPCSGKHRDKTSH